MKDPEVIQKRLQHYKSLQKKCYDRGARNFPVLKQGDVLRIRGEKGFPHKGVIIEKSKYPRSYLVKSSSGTCRRNGRHLLKVEEPIEEFEFKNMDYDSGDRSKEQNSMNNPRSPSIQEHLATNEQMKSEGKM